MDEPTSRDACTTRFAYCFVQPPGSDYPPIATEHRLKAGRAVDDRRAGRPDHGRCRSLQDHGDIPSLGFRFGKWPIRATCSGMPDGEPPQRWPGLDVWIVDALRYRPHPSHFSVADALAWIERVKPKRAILTNLHTDLDYEVLRRNLPPHVEPGFDG